MMSHRGILATHALTKRYRGRVVVHEVSLQVRAGEIVGLLGPNGAGKTTTFYLLVGLEKPDAGTVYMDGCALTSLAMHQRARLGIGYLPQEPSIFRKMTVEENILAILETRLRSRAELLQWIADAGLSVAGRLDTTPRHPKAQDKTDPLHQARAAEVTSLWRLKATEAVDMTDSGAGA